MTVVGFVLYGSTVLLPLLMQELLGYTATHAGITNLPRGLASFMLMPVVGYLTGKVDARKLLAAGFLVTALGHVHDFAIQPGRGFVEFLAAAHSLQPDAQCRG
jgi:DHA2 family multidrug resistance protein